MQTTSITSLTELENKIKNGGVHFLLIHKKDADQSECAFQRIKSISGLKIPEILTVDVGTVRDIHANYGITSAPSLLEFIDGELKNVYKGCQSEAFYKSAISGFGFVSSQIEEGKKVNRVIVYTTPSCSWCTTIKTYLSENNVKYIEVDVASNPSKAEEMVRKSGQQGVPQTEINGTMIVGFDKNRINQLLDIR